VVAAAGFHNRIDFFTAIKSDKASISNVIQPGERYFVLGGLRFLHEM